VKVEERDIAKCADECLQLSLLQSAAFEMPVQWYYPQEVEYLVDYLVQLTEPLFEIFLAAK
jgi:hypothetical protein